MTPAEKADRAQELLANPLFKACFAELRESFVRRLEVEEDPEDQRELAISLRILRQVKTQVEKLAQGDPVDKHRIKQDNFASRIKQRLTP